MLSLPAAKAAEARALHSGAASVQQAATETGSKPHDSLRRSRVASAHMTDERRVTVFENKPACVRTNTPRFHEGRGKGHRFFSYFARAPLRPRRCSAVALRDCAFCFTSRSLTSPALTDEGCRAIRSTLPGLCSFGSEVGDADLDRLAGRDSRMLLCFRL